jgi:hypothetical protein
MGLLGSSACVGLRAFGVPMCCDAAPKECNPLNWVELDGGKRRGSGGARAEMFADLLGECYVDGKGEGRVRVGGEHGAARIVGLKRATLEARMKKLWERAPPSGV